MELAVTFSSSLEDEVTMIANKAPLNTIVRYADKDKRELVVHVEESTFDEMHNMLLAMVSMVNAAKDMAGMIEKLWSSKEFSSLGTSCESSNENTTE